MIQLIVRILNISTESQSEVAPETLQQLFNSC